MERLLNTLYCPTDVSIKSYNPVKIKKEGEAYIVTPINPAISSEEMFRLRNKAKDKDPSIQERKMKELGAKIRKELSGDGHVFANLGLSTLLTTEYQGKNYFVLVRANRNTVWKDFGNKDTEIMKPVSGYIESENTSNPINALKLEIETEILPVTKGGKLLPAFMNGKPLGRPFEGEYPLFQYEERAGFNITTPGIWKPFPQRKVLIAGKEVEGNPSIYFHIGTDSAQLLFNYRIDFLPNEDVLERLSISLNHSEDKISSDKQKLDTFYYPEGLVAIELDSVNLTHQASTFSNGRLKPFVGSIELSELFVTRDNDDIIPLFKDTISLEDLVKS